ncbi:MAG: AAA family ATPase [Pseudomonadota bacterium]
MPRLIVFSGLPASGKSSIARGVARGIGAIWIRIDSIEQAIRDSGIATGSVDDAGYRAAYAVAEDNLLLGQDVVGDSVNGWALTRDAWRDVGLRAGALVIEFEIVCSDLAEHRRRVETRLGDIPGLNLPDWQSVADRDYQPWDRERILIDTAGRDVETCIGIVLAAVPGA